MMGRVCNVAQKSRPADPNQVAWNHALGCSFENVRWGDWNLRLCVTAMKAAKLSGLDYAAVDMMVEEGTLTPYVIEINSAGSLPTNSDGSPSIRARAVAKSLGWHLTNENYDHFDLVEEAENWRDVIHPAIWSNHPANQEDVPMFRSVRSGQTEYVHLDVGDFF